MMAGESAPAWMPLGTHSRLLDIAADSDLMRRVRLGE